VLGQCKEWDECLPFCRAAYSAAPNLIHGFSPFFVAHLREFQTPLESILTIPVEEFDDPHDYVSKAALYTRKTMEFLREKRNQYKQKVVDRANQGMRKDHQYAVGDLVLVFVPVRPKEGSKKLSAYRWHGPHAIEARHGLSTYIIKLCHSDKDLSTYRVVNHSRLKPYKDGEGVTQVKQYLSKGIASKEETQEMIESFDRMLVSPALLDAEQLGAFGTVQIQGEPVLLQPTGLVLPVSAEEGIDEASGVDMTWAWEQGEGALIDEERGPGRGRWVTDKPAAPVSGPSADQGSSATMARRFLAGHAGSQEKEGDDDEEDACESLGKEFNEEDEDDAISIQAKIATPLGCVSVVLEEDRTVKQIAAKYFMTIAKLVGLNKFSNPGWTPAVTGLLKSKDGVGQSILRRGSVIWIPESHHHAGQVGGQAVVEHEVHSIVKSRRVGKNKEYLVHWSPSTVDASGNQVVMQEWPDSWVKSHDLNCDDKVTAFECGQSSSIGMG